ncbi:MAG: TIGR02391 family protein [Nitrospirae bacterium]|nr:TIGR02391 family protein [Nitrospirota bacterium]
MAKSLLDIAPEPKAIFDVTPEELAGVVLEYLNSLSDNERGQLNRNNFSLHVQDTYRRVSRNLEPKISEAYMEAWVWLEREGMIAPTPGRQGEWVFLTRKGRQYQNPTDLSAYRIAASLPREMLHSLVAEKAWPLFMRAEYDTAVFQAFKEVEVAVRKAGGFALTDIGVDLMRKAFNPTDGPFADHSRPAPEREAVAHLFAGSIGLFKNPHSHRNEPITNVQEAFEMLVIAGHLLRILDSRSESPKAGPRGS